MDGKPTHEELERQIRDLNQSAGRSDLDLLESLPVGISISTPKGVVLDVNLAGLRMFGYTSKEAFLKIQASDHYLNPNDRERFKALNEQGAVKDFETQLVKKDGSVFWAAVTSIPRPALEKRGPYYLNVFQDISARKAATERSGHLDRVLRAIRHVNQLITRETDPNRLIQGICNSLIETRGYYNAWIALMDPSRAVAATTEAGLGAAFEPMVGRLRQGILTLCAQRALSEGGVITVRDPASACRDCPLSTAYGNRGAMTVRLETEKRAYGLLSASIPSHLVNDTEEQALFREMAEDVSFALQGMEERSRRIQAEEALQESEKALRRAKQNLEDRLQAVLSPGKSPDDLMITDIMDVEILQEINRIFAEVFDVTMLLTDADGNYLTEPDNISDFCEVIRETDKGLRQCKASDAQLARQVKDAITPVVTRCSNAGFMDAALPVRIGGRHVASWLVGQFRPPGVDEADVRRIAREIGADEGRLLNAFGKLKRRPVEYMEKVLKMLDLFTQEISKYGLNNLKLARAVTKEQKAEEEKKQKEKFARSVIESMTDGISILDINGVHIDVNDAFCRMTGFARAELIGAGLPHPYWPKGNYDAIQKAFEATLQGDLFDVELVFKRKNGERFPVLISPFVVLDKDGKTVSYVASVKDISERKRADEALRESKVLLDTAARTALFGGWSVNLAEDKASWSDQVSAIHEVPPNYSPTVEEGIKFYAPEFREKISKVFGDCVRLGIPYDEEMKIITLKGNRVWVRTTGEAVRNESGVITGAQGSFQNITERKRMEEEILKAEKIESIGVFAGGLAHDFNNILTTVLGNASMAKYQASPGSEIFELLSEVEKASKRAQALTQQLLTFAKGGAPVKETASLEDIVKESSRFVMSGSKSACEYSIPEDLWTVEIDVGQISQVINNIVINANQAMPEGGVIEIKAENLDIDEVNQWELKPGKYVRMSFKDDGIGIPEKHLSKIFDPYFTTKQTGSGLGLATTYSIIHRHGGIITVESHIGIGTSLHIYLPASEKEIQEKKEEELLTGEGHILVMDDEASLRKILGKILNKLGYTSESVKDGAEAIRMVKEAKQAKKPYDAVILDLTIPGGMGGREAIQKLLAIDPEIKAIVSSGYSDDPIVAQFQKYGFKGRLAKPFEFGPLSRVLREVIKGE